VNKATGLVTALKELGYSTHNAVGIGDAENDHALLTVCECGAAVGNGVAALKERADIVTRGAEGVAVVELIEHLLADDLESIGPKLARHSILLGTTPEGRAERISPYGKNLLVAGTSGSGKSVLMAGVLERLADAKYQYALIDPEGRYQEVPGAVVLGSAKQPPLIEEALPLLAGGRNAHVNLAGIPLRDRAGFFDQLFPRLRALRRQTGRPHWIVIDEAHMLTPTAWSAENVPERVRGVAMVTVHPGRVSPAMLRAVDVALALGQDPAKTLAEFFEAGRIAAPSIPPTTLQPGEALGYAVSDRRGPFRLIPPALRVGQQRDRRKVAEGRLPDDRVFVFRGPDGKLKLRAYNLRVFLELADGVDDDTWFHHLKGKEYSKWFRDAIKDDDLARDAAVVESKFANNAEAGREAMREVIQQRYSLPAVVPSATLPDVSG
jgi:hypothetical protein